MSSKTLSGSCLCGHVKFQVKDDFQAFYHCHCGRCRKSTGTGHASNLLGNPESLTWLAGEDDIGNYDLPDARFFGRNFCTRCGGPVPRISRAREILVVPAGTLDDESKLTPQARIFSGSKAGWSCGEESVPAYDEYVTGD
jgi:hypothetical protein